MHHSRPGEWTEQFNIENIIYITFNVIIGMIVISIQHALFYQAVVGWCKDGSNVIKWIITTADWMEPSLTCNLTRYLHVSIKDCQNPVPISHSAEIGPMQKISLLTASLPRQRDQRSTPFPTTPWMSWVVIRPISPDPIKRSPKNSTEDRSSQHPVPFPDEIATIFQFFKSFEPRQ